MFLKDVVVKPETMKTTITNHLIRKENMNHHDTLYAGRGAEWLIETAYMAAGDILQTNSIVAVKIGEINYLSPVHAGEVLRMEGKAVCAGKTSLTVYVVANVGDQKTHEGFVTFVRIGEDGRPQPHGITIEPETEEAKALQERAKKLLSC